MLWRWVLSLAAAGGCSLALVFAVHTMQQLQLQEDLRSRLQQRQQDLQQWREAHKRLQARLEQWNRLWQTVQETPLAATTWQRYPVQIQKSLFPSEASNVLQLLSNDINAGTDFWFVPRQVEATPVQRTEEQSNSSQPAVQLQIQGQMLRPESANKGGHE